MLICCFRFLAWTFNHKTSSLFLELFCFVLRWWTSGTIISERLFIAKCCHQEWAAHALLTFCSRWLMLCSRFAHALLRPAEVPFESFRFLWVLTRFLLGPYEDLLTVCSRFAHGLLMVCSRFARAAHALLMLCSRFGGWCVACLDGKTHKQTMSLFCCSEPCVHKAHSFQAADSLGWFSNLKKIRPHATHNPSLQRGCHTPQPEICMCNVPFEPKGATFLLSPKDSESTLYIMVLWHVPL